MARAKKKRLPKDFAELLAKGDLDELKAVFATCDVNARGGYANGTAISFDACPDDLARWLVAEGADIEATDKFGSTPLQSRTANWDGRIEVLLELGADVHRAKEIFGTALHIAASGTNLAKVKTLLDFGAEVDLANGYGYTPLELVLMSDNLPSRVLPVAELLLSAGARVPARAKELVTRAGKDFEFARETIPAEYVGAASAALERLYALFDVPPVPRRAMHDGVSPIAVEDGPWRRQYGRLWDALVPASGAAATAQGEAIRIAGRISHEIDDNGGMNWNADFRRMADAFRTIVGSGEPLPPELLAAAAAVVAEVKGRSGDAARMRELAVAWVRLNPVPIPLGPPAYNL